MRLIDKIGLVAIAAFAVIEIAGATTTVVGPEYAFSNASTVGSKIRATRVRDTLKFAGNGISTGGKTVTISGSFTTFSSLAERDALPMNRRSQGMEASINGTVFQLYSGIENANWRKRDRLATTSSDGLMSKEDKKKVDGITVEVSTESDLIIAASRNESLIIKLTANITLTADLTLDNYRLTLDGGGYTIDSAAKVINVQSAKVIKNTIFDNTAVVTTSTSSVDGMEIAFNTFKGLGFLTSVDTDLTPRTSDNINGLHIHNNTFTDPYLRDFVIARGYYPGITDQFALTSTGGIVLFSNGSTVENNTAVALDLLGNGVPQSRHLCTFWGKNNVIRNNIHYGNGIAKNSIKSYYYPKASYAGNYIGRCESNTIEGNIAYDMVAEFISIENISPLSFIVTGVAGNTITGTVHYKGNTTDLQANADTDYMVFGVSGTELGHYGDLASLGISGTTVTMVTAETEGDFVTANVQAGDYLGVSVPAKYNTWKHNKTIMTDSSAFSSFASGVGVSLWGNTFNNVIDSNYMENMKVPYISVSIRLPDPDTWETGMYTQASGNVFTNNTIINYTHFLGFYGYDTGVGVDPSAPASYTYANTISLNRVRNSVTPATTLYNTGVDTLEGVSFVHAKKTVDIGNTWDTTYIDDAEFTKQSSMAGNIPSDADAVAAFLVGYQESTGNSRRGFDIYDQVGTTTRGPAISGLNSSGTTIAPGQTIADAQCFGLTGFGRDDTGVYRPVGNIVIRAESAPISTSAPGYLDLRTTPTGAVVQSTALRVGSDKTVTLWDGAVSSTPPTNTNSARLLVNGKIESRTGGVVFPDATTQTTAVSPGGVSGSIQYNNGSGGITGGSYAKLGGVDGGTLTITELLWSGNFPQTFVKNSVADTSTDKPPSAAALKSVSDRIPLITANYFPKMNAGGTAYEASQQYFSGAGNFIEGSATFLAAVGSSNDGTFRAYYKNGTTPPAAGDVRIGAFFGGGYDGTTQRISTEIGSYTDSAWTYGTDQPSYLKFSTTPDGTAARTEKMRIASSGLQTFSNGGGPPFGQQYSNTSTTVAVASSGTWYEITTNMSAGLMKNVTHGGSHYMVATTAGYYRIHQCAALGTSAAGDEVALATAVNGTADASSHGHATIITATTTSTVCSFTIANLAQGAEVSMVLQNHSAARDISISHSQQSMEYIGSP